MNATAFEPALFDGFQRGAGWNSSTFKILDIFSKKYSTKYLVHNFAGISKIEQ